MNGQEPSQEVAVLKSETAVQIAAVGVIGGFLSGCHTIFISKSGIGPELNAATQAAIPLISIGLYVCVRWIWAVHGPDNSIKARDIKNYRKAIDECNLLLETDDLTDEGAMNIKKRKEQYQLNLFDTITGR